MAKKGLGLEVEPAERKPSFRLEDKDYSFLKGLEFNQAMKLKVSVVVKSIDEAQYEDEKPVLYEFQIQDVEVLKGDKKVGKSVEEEERDKKAVKVAKKKKGKVNLAGIIAEAIKGKV